MGCRRAITITGCRGLRSSLDVLDDSPVVFEIVCREGQPTLHRGSSGALWEWGRRRKTACLIQELQSTYGRVAAHRNQTSSESINLAQVLAVPELLTAACPTVELLRKRPPEF